ncbi:phosphoribosyltransferase [Vulcanisaeta distributa]|uniref:Phosphoribosyltransferase n=1 Tax=Vulcanisaeta distributa (strain DSM 14429 / JCM 11212 / NBRC 100878 / IC-017) TaxID=572478 RepID=E1QV83_VULDI|nr:phosphoribosyltransferase [Vulcanisaeta distributa]ADN50010.1 phosphoribosyltransferase [Vulcanisaeta distributa DSM 14429]
MEFLVLNWQRLVDLTLDLSLMVKESGYRPDSIIAILRGGYIVGKLVSDFLGIDDLAVLGLVSYGTKIGQGEEPVVTYPIIRDLRGKSVLVVDDVADTGKTLATARDLTRFYGAREVRVATLYVKPWSRVKPDYYVGVTDKWVLFPWEVGEVVRNQAQGSDPESVIRNLRLSEYFGNDFVTKLARLLH